MREEPSDRYHVESVERALRLMRLLAQQGSLRLSDASGVLGTAPSTTHRLLNSLVRQGFATRSLATRRYLTGPMLQELAALLDDPEVATAARPQLARLAETYGETLHLILVRGRRAEFVDGIESPRHLRTGVRIGQKLPAHCCSGGKAVLALLPDGVVDALYPSDPLERLTPTSLTSRTQLRGQLAEVRRRGYAVNDRESEPDLRAVAAAIIDRHGRPRAALALAAPASRLPLEEIPLIAEALRDAARTVGAELG